MRPHIVCFSGGHSSARVAEAVVRRFGADATLLVNHDIHASVEDADIKRFRREISAKLGVPVTQVDHPHVDTMDQFDVVIAARAFKVKNGQELCTARLKTEPFVHFLRKYVPPGSATIYYGYDANELHRMQRRTSVLGAMGYATDYPLALWKGCIDSTQEIGVEPPLTYGVWKHANCLGCLKAGWQHWYVVYCTRPDLWAKGKYAEEVIGYSIHSDGYLEDREEQFAAMKAAGVEPTERTHPNAFWADARKRVALPIVVDVAAESKPCECVFRKPLPLARFARDVPPCTCGVDVGQPHALGCARVFGDDPREWKRDAA